MRGYDLDSIHFTFFCEHYTNIRSRIVAAIEYDIYKFSYALHRMLKVNFSSTRIAAGVRTSALFCGFSLLKETAPYKNIDAVNTASHASRYFQRPATETMSNIIDFHNDLMVVLIFISVFIFVLLSVCLLKYGSTHVESFYLWDRRVSRLNHDGLAEIIFTTVPAAIVFAIAAPSFALLYSNND